MENYTKKDSIRVKKIWRYSNAISGSDPEKAIDLKKEALDLSKNIKWKKGIAFILFALADNSLNENNINEAISYSIQALNEAEDIGDLKMIANSHSLLSDAYRLSGDDSSAEVHALIFLDMARSMKNDKMILQAEVMLINDYIQSEKWNKADSLLPKAIMLAINLKNEYSINRLLWGKASILEHDGKFKESIKIIEQVLPYYLNGNNYHPIAYSYSWISELFTRIRRKDSAFYYAKAALDIAKEHDLKKELGDANRAFYIYYYAFGNYKKALEYKTIYDSIQYETFKWTSAQNIAHTKLQIEQQKKDALEKEAEMKKEAEATRIRNIGLTVIAAFILLVIFLFWNNRQKQKAKSRIEAAYSELKSTQAQLIQSEKMASLGELTAGIAHEIQNPLNFVNNFSDINSELLDELKSELATGNMQSANEIADDIKANEEKINHHGKRADAIVKGMLQHSRTSTGQKEPTDINALCDEYLRLAYHGMRAKDKSFNCEMKTDFDSTLPKINVVPQDIGRVILNLINNAFYACAERKNLEGFQKLQGLAPYLPTVTVSTKNLGGKVEISVRDNGNGIPEKIKDKIFQPFFTTKPTGQGTGLGLSLSYDIMKAQGGEIKVESRDGDARPDDMVGRGTEFLVTLPVTQ
ncbi:MAG: ATP-binding protein [Chitinophagaceae bacterium]|nr:ATP-binding protein [Chitinophagaceae bacterium]